MPSQINEKKIASRFNKAAISYDEAAVLQRVVGTTLLERLREIQIQARTILDLGCGTGHFTPLLGKAYPDAHVIGFDCATGMLEQARSKGKAAEVSRVHWVGGLAEFLPFPENSFDLIYSNLMLHWSVDLEKTLLTLYRVLKPGGLFLFSMVGTDTLKELRHCWSVVDHYVHIHAFPDMHDIGDLLLQTAFVNTVMDVDRLVLLYSKVSHLMRDLRALGVQNLAVNRHRGLTSKGSLQALIRAYEVFRTPFHQLPATWEIIYGQAWVAPKTAKPVTSADSGEVSISLDSIGGLRYPRRGSVLSP